MDKNKKPIIVSIIPARGGSKGIINKNIREICNKPLIAYSIEASNKASLVDYTFVSTENSEIAEIAKRYGAEIINRPIELSEDHVPDLPVLKHAIEYLEIKGIFPDILVWLRPPNLFRSCSDINNTIQKMLDTNADTVRTVHLVKESPYWMQIIDEEKILKPFIEGGEIKYYQRQLLPKVYKASGIVDVTKRDVVMKQGKLFSKENHRALVIDRAQVVDLDNEDDLLVAEYILKNVLGENFHQKSSKKAIFFDRDATLNEDEKYTYKIEDFKLLPKVIEGLKKLKNFDFFIISNQSGIGRGYYTLKDVEKFNNHMLNEFKKHGINIKKIYLCPHAPEKNCDCRKPKTKFLKQAEKEFNLDLNNCYVIGNRETDILLAKNADCKSILVPTNGKEFDLMSINPDYRAEDLEKAAEYILKNN
tara:strand:- start:16677 stop:17933 length:1257 start_codon:yes stop_codon:yes gene_type:complete